MASNGTLQGAASTSSSPGSSPDTTGIEPTSEDKYTKVIRERALQSDLGMQAFVPDWARAAGAANAASQPTITAIQTVDLETSDAASESAGAGQSSGQSTSGSDIDDPDWF
jgi:hypothetical protein